MNYLDTNIFIRYLTRDNEEKFEKCSKLFLEIEKKNASVKTVESVISEVVYVLSSKKIGYNFKRQEIAEKLTSILSLENLEIKDKKIYFSALALFEKTKLDFEDCILISNLKAEDKLYSYDLEFDSVIKNRLEP